MWLKQFVNTKFIGKYILRATITRSGFFNYNCYLEVMRVGEESPCRSESFSTVSLKKAYRKCEELMKPYALQYPRNSL